MTLISFSFIPLDVTAGVPIRIPLVINGLWVSNGTAFLFTVIPDLSSAVSKFLPVIFFELRSTKKRCVSVPPDTILKPRSFKYPESAAVFFNICRWYLIKSDFIANLKAVPFAAIICISGPPWIPGNTALLTFIAISSFCVKIKPPRGPRNVLWVVDVTISA